MNILKQKHHVVPNKVVKRLILIFPCVIWQDNKNNEKYKGYFNHNGDTTFHKILSDMITKQGASYYTIVESFYKYKKNSSSSNQREVFFHMLPKAKETIMVPIEQKEFNKGNVQNPHFKEGGYYYLYNKCVIEQNFKKSLEALENIQLNTIPGNNSFMLSNEYKLTEWICHYVSKSTRFKWEKTAEKLFHHKATNPWNEFKYYCQYCYTLIRVGLESEKQNKKKGKTLSEYMAYGDKVITSSFINYPKNMEFGIADKLGGADDYHIKSCSETRKVIGRLITCNKANDDFLCSPNNHRRGEECSQENVKEIEEIVKGQIMTERFLNKFVEKFPNDNERQYCLWLKKMNSLLFLEELHNLIEQEDNLENNDLIKGYAYICGCKIDNAIIRVFKSRAEEVRDNLKGQW